MSDPWNWRCSIIEYYHKSETNEWLPLNDGMVEHGDLITKYCTEADKATRFFHTPVNGVHWAYNNGANWELSDLKRVANINNGDDWERAAGHFLVSPTAAPH